VTIGMYYRVTGESTQNRGVQPDITLPSAISVEDVGESSRKGALPWNRIKTATFKPEGSVAPVLGELERDHEARVANDPDFRYASGEIAAIEAMRKEKSISLNLKDRQAERERTSQERLARENARRTAEGQAPLKTVDEIKDPPDAMLAEAAQITADYVELEPRLVARAGNSG
jgi:carboxyl-terminal processing protease